MSEVYLLDKVRKPIENNENIEFEFIGNKVENDTT